MKKINLSLMVLSMVLALNCGPAVGADISISQTMVDGKFYDYRVSEDSLAKVPSWNPLEEAAPLPPDKAVSIARDFIKKQKGDLNDYLLNQISIGRVVSKKIKNRWFYTLMILKRGDTMGGMNVFVMMDGSVVEPVQVQSLGTVCPEEE